MRYRTDARALPDGPNAEGGNMWAHREVRPTQTRVCQCKYMIYRRLGPFLAFFSPFLSHKGLISRRLHTFRGEISHGPSGLAPRRGARGLGRPGVSRLVIRCPGFDFSNARTQRRQDAKGGSRSIEKAIFKMEDGKRRRSSQRDDPTFGNGQNPTPGDG
jgi:hypothetical protein